MKLVYTSVTFIMYQQLISKNKKSGVLIPLTIGTIDVNKYKKISVTSILEERKQDYKKDYESVNLIRLMGCD